MPGVSEVVQVVGGVHVGVRVLVRVSHRSRGWIVIISNLVSLARFKHWPADRGVLFRPPTVAEVAEAVGMGREVTEVAVVAEVAEEVGVVTEVREVIEVVEVVEVAKEVVEVREVREEVIVVVRMIVCEIVEGVLVPVLVIVSVSRVIVVRVTEVVVPLIFVWILRCPSILMLCFVGVRGEVGVRGGSDG